MVEIGGGVTALVGGVVVHVESKSFGRVLTVRCDTGGEFMVLESAIRSNVGGADDFSD